MKGILSRMIRVRHLDGNEKEYPMHILYFKNKNTQSDNYIGLRINLFDCILSKFEFEVEGIEYCDHAILLEAIDESFYIIRKM